jgi:hypothetical protein
MKTEELSELVDALRRQANTWMGEEACAQLERLIAYTERLHGTVEAIERLRADGYRMIQTGSGQHTTN